MQFKSPRDSLGDLDAEAAATLLGAAADVALIIDSEGVICDLAFGTDELAHELQVGGPWLHRTWAEVATVDSRLKVDALKSDALRSAVASQGAARWRHINHPSVQGADVPILYSAVKVGRKDRIVAVGRDLRGIAAMQQRLVDAQQSMERDYSRLRLAETRYRVLFETSSEALVIVDAPNQKVVEANPAAAELLGLPPKRIVGRPLAEWFDVQGVQALRSMMSALETAGRADDALATLGVGARALHVSATVFRQDAASLFLLRLAPADGASNVIPWPTSKSRMLKAIERATDGFVVTDAEGRVLTANKSFLDLVELTSEEQARGEPMDQWFQRPGVDLNVLMGNLRQRGAVRLFASSLRGTLGTISEVEISAVSVVNGDVPFFGFTIRNVGRRLPADSRTGRTLPRSVEQLTELIGRVSLKDLVRETTDVVERLCIEAALELTGDNRASAAEMLGLSRQSLYVKLRRYGLAEFAAEGGATE